MPCEMPQTKSVVSEEMTAKFEAVEMPKLETKVYTMTCATCDEYEEAGTRLELKGSMICHAEETGHTDFLIKQLMTGKVKLEGGL